MKAKIIKVTDQGDRKLYLVEFSGHNFEPFQREYSYVPAQNSIHLQDAHIKIIVNGKDVTSSCGVSARQLIDKEEGK